MALRTKFVQVLTGVSEIDPSQAAEQAAFFNPDGTPFDFSGAGFNVVAAVADISTANGSDPATTQALANANKAKINELLGKLRTAGILAP